MVNLLTIKSILKKIKFHPIFFFLAFISILTGLFKDFLVLSSVIFFHEMGHVIVSQFLKWNIKTIKFYPFGGMIKFDEKINKPIKEELLITVSGLLFQTLYFLIICVLYHNYIISDQTFLMFKNYHYSIFLFNLVPIYPLDGIKLVNLLLCKILPFKISHFITIMISYFFLIIFILFLFTSSLGFLSMNVIMILSLLLIKILEEQKNHNYYFNKFLFERYLYKFNFNKVKVINNSKLDKMYRDKKHIFKSNNEYVTENIFLRKKFKK